MEGPLVTVFTITRNRCDLLPRAINSVLNQTYHNIEYIIIDSASTDKTEEVVNSISDERIRYVKIDQNDTFGHCFNNIVLQIAKGKYLTGLDDDDEYVLNKIEKQVLLFETLPIEYGMVYCWMTYYDSNTLKKLFIHKTELRGSVFEEVVERPKVSGTPTLMFRRLIFDTISGYKEMDEVGIESDWELAVRVCERYKVDFVPESLVNVYVNHGHTRMSNAGAYYVGVDKKLVTFHNYFLKSYAVFFNKNPQLTWYHLRGLVSAYYHMGDFKNGYKYYRELLRVKHDLKSIIVPVEALLRRIFGK